LDDEPDGLLGDDEPQPATRAVNVAAVTAIRVR
jgi:hypothetical protein